MALYKKTKDWVYGKRDWVLGYNIRMGHDTLENWVLYRLKITYIACKTFYDKSLFSKDVGALTYSTFMSLVPLIAVLFAIARSCGLDDIFIGWLSSVMTAQPQMADSVVKYVHNYLLNTSNQAIILVGIGFMLYPLYSLMNKIDISFSGIWGVNERPLGGRLFRDYVLLYLVFTVLLILVLFVNLKALYMLEIMAAFDVVSDMTSLLLPAMSVIPLTIFFLVMYCFVPNTRVHLSTALVPSLASAILMEALKYGYIYVQVFLTSYNVIYGSLAILPLFLLWLQCVWVIIEIGVAWCYAAQCLNLDKEILLIENDYADNL